MLHGGVRDPGTVDKSARRSFHRRFRRRSLEWEEQKMEEGGK